MAVQLPLKFEFQSTQNFISFYPGINAEIISHLQTFAVLSNEQQIYLWGDPGTGKSHLLKACCLEADHHRRKPFYLNFSLNNPLPDPEILGGLENFDIVCLDNIDRIGGNPLWEHAFFNFYNQHRDNDNQLLLAASCPPKFLTFQLPDLKSRMSWGLTLKLHTLEDEQIIKAMNYKAATMGFSIPSHVGRFLQSHYQRDLPGQWQLLERIDRATLAAKRKLTIPFLKQIMSNND